MSEQTTSKKFVLDLGDLSPLSTRPNFPAGQASAEHEEQHDDVWSERDPEEEGGVSLTPLGFGTGGSGDGDVNVSIRDEEEDGRSRRQTNSSSSRPAAAGSKRSGSQLPAIRENSELQHHERAESMSLELTDDNSEDGESLMGDHPPETKAAWEAMRRKAALAERLKPRAPTMMQLRQEVIDDADEENEKFGVVHIRSTANSATCNSMEDLERLYRLDDMTLEEMEKNLNRFHAPSGYDPDADGQRRLDLGTYKLELRYQARKEIVPDILANYNLSKDQLSITFSSTCFLEGMANYIVFSGSNTEAVENAYNEVKQFLDYTQGPPPDFIREVDLHDLLAFSDIVPNMLVSHNMRPFITVRKNCVLFSLGELRCIVGHHPVQLVLIFGLMDQAVTVPASEALMSTSEKGAKSPGKAKTRRGPLHKDSVLAAVQKMQALLSAIEAKATDDAHEYACYKAILFYVTVYLESQVEYLTSQATSLMNTFEQLKYNVSNDHFEDLQAINKTLTELIKSMSSHRTCVEGILNEPVLCSMKALSLLREPSNAHYRKLAHTSSSALLSIPEMRSASRYIERMFLTMWEKIKKHEMVLAKTADSIEEKIGHVRKASDDMMTTVLVLNTAITIVGTCIGLGGMITGAFGMNLDQTEWLTPISGCFVAVCVASAVLVFGLAPILILSFVAVGWLPNPAASTKRTWAQYLCPDTCYAACCPAEDSKKLD